MKKLSRFFLLLILLLGACSNNSAATKSAVTENPISTDAASVEPVDTESVAATESAVSARQAVISKIENDVMVRATPEGKLVPATSGVVIGEGGSIETGSDSRVSIDLLPDGTIVRIGPNSSFTLTSLTEEDGQPKTKLELLFGQVFIILNGGSLDVESSTGVATVRGSLMSVTISRDKKHVTLTCLEGHCRIKNNDKDVDLVGGQAINMVDGNLDGDVYEMTFEELGLWMLENPDLENYIVELPDLSDLPEGFDWNYDFENDPDFEFYYDPEYDPGEEFFEPTLEPTEEPTLEPTEAPVEEPTEAPVEEPTEAPVEEPTETPIEEPTDVP